MDNLETSLVTTVYKKHVNTGAVIVETSIKPRASTMLHYLVYSLYGQVRLLQFQVHMRSFFSIAFGIWIGEFFLKMDSEDQSGWMNYIGTYN